MKALYKALAAGISASLLCLGCGSGLTIISSVSPSISQVVPQAVPAGTPSVTVTVKGSNFNSQSSLTVNGATVPTSVVSSDTLAGQISGPALAQPSVAQLQVRNSNGTASNPVSLTVTDPQQTTNALAITTTTLPAAQTGSTYSTTLAATGGTSGYTWAVTAGSLPAGLSLSPAGVISGTPTVNGTANFTVTVTDSGSPAQTQTLAMNLAVSPAMTAEAGLTITTGALTTAQVGLPYSMTLTANGGTPGYTWSVSAGTLPAGLSLSAAGVISGTPTASGSSSVTISVSDSGTPVQTQIFAGTLVVKTPQLTVATSSLAAGQNGSAYSATLVASGGTPGYTWAVASGSLPAGLSLSSAGVVSGTPTASGSSSFVVAVTDSGSPAQTVSVMESITIKATTLTVASGALAAGQNGIGYSATVAASGGTPGYTWSVAAGTLPAGLSLSPGGVISGTPTVSGTSSFTVAVSDSGSPAQTVSATESITVKATTLTIASGALAAGQNGAAYSVTLAASGGTPGYTWTVSAGSLPAGLSLSPGGVISGAPTGSGTSSFTVAVSDSGSPTQVASATESIVIASKATTLTIASGALASGQNGAAYSATLAASGGTPGYTWTVASGSLPAGLTLSPAGGISGTPTGSGTSSFTVAVTDSGSPAQVVSATESITVAAATLAIAPGALGAGEVGVGYAAGLQATGGTPGYTWTLASGNLPAGLTLGSDGTISGTPATTGTADFSVTVADSGSPAQTKSAQETITINAAPPPPSPTAGAASLYLYPMTPVAPQGSYQTVTAIVTGVNDKTVTWTADGGTIVGTNPCVVNEPCTVALYATTPGTYHLTATSNANGSMSQTSTITITPSPAPVSTHPRLLITAAMLPELRMKAVSSNPMYAAMRATAITYYNTDKAVWSWSCNGGSGLPSSDQSGASKEIDAYYFALMALLAPSDPTYNWGCYGRDVWTYVMKAVVNGNENITGNHWSDDSPYLGVTTDWLMGSNSLSTGDEAVARQFLAYIGKTVVGYYPASPPVTGYNSAALFNTGSTSDLVDMRVLGSNYTQSKMLLLAAVGLTFNDDATDDPALANSCSATRYQMCADHTAGSLHAYWSYFDGSMLYMDWAHLEDPNVSWQAYQAAYHNLPTQPACTYMDGSQHPCFGDSRDGASSEGSWYQYSLYRLRYALNMLHTAGYDDPMRYGPQVSLGTSSWWDLKYVNDLSMLTGFSAKNGPAVCADCVSPAFGYLTTGDSNTYYRTPNDMMAESAMMMADSYVGRTDRSNALEWMILNTSYGGPDGKQDGCTTWCGFDANMGGAAADGVALDLFTALPASDPVASLPNDPRPDLPTDFVDGSYAQQVILRSGWTANDTLFSYYCTNTLIDHEHEFCGRFDIYSKGEYITKGRVEFNDYNDVMSAAPQSNVASYMNPTGSGCATTSCLDYYSVLYGGEFWHGEQQGIIRSLAHSELSTYAAMTVDTTAAYNGWWAYSYPHDVASYNDVQAASRDVVYLRSANQVVFFDRGETGSEAAKSISLITTGIPGIDANSASWMTRSGTQKAYYTSLLPADGTLSAPGLVAGGVDQTGDWEPASEIEVSAGSPTSAQFLSVLEWGSSTFVKSTTSLVSSSAGQTFDGALVGSSVVMFMRDWPATFTGVTYPASGATTQYVSDLTPNTKYSISADGAPASATTDDAGVLTFSSAGTGSITVGTPTVP